jgi:hypothetical protein
MQEFFDKLEQAAVTCRLELADTDDPKAVRTLRSAIVTIEEIIRLVEADQRQISEAARTPWGEGRAASL